MQPLTEVTLSKFAEKQLKRIPKYIAEAFYYWVGLEIQVIEVNKHEY